MIGTSILTRVSAAAALSAAAIVGPALLAAPRTAPVERYSATAINMGVPGRAGAGVIEIGIEHWSTDADRDRLLTVLWEKGSDALLSELQKMPRVGYIRNPSSVGYDLHYARKSPTGDGAERIVLATDRPIGFWEAANQPRSVDYPFTVVEIRLGPDGKGEGKLSLATKILADREAHEIVLENFASQPVQLTNVRRDTSH
jgi:hypothetical protein